MTEWTSKTEGMKSINRPTREEREDMAAAHADGLHAELPREFCPECEQQGGRR